MISINGEQRGVEPDSPSASRGDTWYLLLGAGSRQYALPLRCVVEVMPLPALEPVAEVPEFVLGLAAWRGHPVPVVDLARLAAGESSQAARAVCVRVAERNVVLAVNQIFGCFDLSAQVMQDVPPLLSSCPGGVTRLGLLDRELLVVLETARVLPEALLATLATAGAA